MKKVLAIFVSVLLGIILMQAQDVSLDTLSYADNFSTFGGGENIIRAVQTKSARVTSEQGSINFNFADNVPDSIETAVRVAGDIWRQYLDGKAEITIGVEYDVLENDIETEVVYGYNTNNPDINYPSSLYNYLFPFNTPSRTAEKDNDGTIFINSGTSWDCNFSDGTVATANNMTYAAMRAIANVLGFGSSVKEYVRRGESKIYFNLANGHSVFDNLIFSSDGNRMRDIPNTGKNKENALLREFIQPTEDTELYALLQSSSYKMYAPSFFEPLKTLMYLDNVNSLMHHDLNTGNKIHQVDDVTINLLREIGWYSQVDTLVNIVSTDIDSTGIASAYTSHGFTVENLSSGTITNARWEYMLPLATGGDSLMSSATNTLSFEIPAVSDENLFVRNVNGDIYGRIIFTGEVNGNAVEDVYTVSLELKPKIMYVADIRKIPNANDGHYDLYFTVCYYGDNHIVVVKEEESNSILRTQLVYEPFLAHVRVENASYGYWAWVDITVKNDYGQDTYTIELPAEETYYMASVPIYLSTDNYIVDVYDISGKRILTGICERELANLQNGLYILEYRNSNGERVRTEKFIKN